MFRLFAAVLFVGSIVVSGYHRRRAQAGGSRIKRSAEPWPFIAGRILVALPLFGAPIAWMVNPRWMAWASFDSPTARWAGVALGLCVVPAVQWVLSNLGRNVSETVLTKSDHELVTAGPYRWVRHPLYSTGIALFLALGLIANNWFILAMTGVAFLALRLVVVPREERALIDRFDGAYERYRAGTGALLPSLSPRMSSARPKGRALPKYR